MRKIFICCIFVLIIISNVVYAVDIEKDNNNLKSNISENFYENKKQDIDESKDQVDINIEDKKNENNKDLEKSNGESLNSQDINKKKVKEAINEKGKQSIEDGEYEIRTVIDKNKIFDIDGGSKITDMARLQCRATTIYCKIYGRWIL